MTADEMQVYVEEHTHCSAMVKVRLSELESILV